MWGCTLHAFYRQPLPRNIHRVTDLTQKYFWGINLVIGYRYATEKYSQTIVLVIVLAAMVNGHRRSYVELEVPKREKPSMPFAWVPQKSLFLGDKPVIQGMTQARAKHDLRECGAGQVAV